MVITLASGVPINFFGKVKGLVPMGVGLQVLLWRMNQEDYYPWEICAEMKVLGAGWTKRRLA